MLGVVDGGVVVMEVVVKISLRLCVVEGKGVCDVVGGATTSVDVGEDEPVAVEELVACVVKDDDCVEGVEGVTITVAVELRRQPPLTQAYPGMQQPPPG